MRVAIVHYLPLEFYPPVTNLLDILVSDAKTAHVFTTANDKGRKVYETKALKIHRYQLPGNESTALRLLKYFSFNIGVLFQLIRLRPSSVLYYETYSAYPVYIYKKYFNRKVAVYIHCHEYFSPDWYRSSMRLLRYYHMKEKGFLYRHAAWISQTNSQRMELFLKDHPYVDRAKMRVIPNFPPATWQKKAVVRSREAAVRCVYVGSLSIANNYITQLCDWVNGQHGEVVFDIYCYNISPDAKDYLKKLNSPYIRYYESGVEYDNIPAVLHNYDVGIIFYKTITLNLRYNATNKMFEYLACGLDVWFSKEMDGCYEFVSRESSPQVVPVDFADLSHFDYRQSVTRPGMPEKKYSFTATEALQPLIDELYKSKENPNASKYIQETTSV